MTSHGGKLPDARRAETWRLPGYHIRHVWSKARGWEFMLSEIRATGGIVIGSYPTLKAAKEATLAR